MKPIIEFKDFSFKYRSQVEPTLRDINLSIYPGEKVLIIGPSGSGKSTLANCLNGLVPFSYPGKITGTITIEGENPADLGIFGMSKKVGTVLQDSDGQFIGLTVAEDIAFVLENDKISQEEMIQKVEDAASLVEVSSLLHHAPTALSGGQKQRVSMAGVMIDNVNILLFDEPLANLDPATGKHAIELIDEIQKKKNATIIIIEHRLEDVLHCEVDRVVVMGNGMIIADMTPDRILASDILREQGIREPLYISALKHAGCRIQEHNHPQHIAHMNISDYKEKVFQWYQKEKLKKVPTIDDRLLQIKNLNFSYQGKRPVLKDINFAINKGEMLSIVGKNGAGKTTLSNLVCGFFHADSGQILWRNNDISELSIKERGEKIGLVMQNPNQMISKAMIFDEVALGLKVRGVPEDEVNQRVYETLQICGLYPFRNWPISALSFGQKKRVTIASILVMNPEILILDEPTAGQDYRHYTEIMEFLKKINKRFGITIIMITHDMHLMLEYTDRTIVIADGSLLAIDTPAHILTNEEIIRKAYLKKTSLYELAIKCGIEDTTDFVDYFISYERKERTNERKNSYI